MIDMIDRDSQVDFPKKSADITISKPGQSESHPPVWLEEANGRRSAGKVPSPSMMRMLPTVTSAHLGNPPKWLELVNGGKNGTSWQWIGGNVQQANVITWITDIQFIVHYYPMIIQFLSYSDSGTAAWRPQNCTCHPPDALGARSLGVLGICRGSQSETETQEIPNKLLVCFIWGIQP